MTPHSPRRAWAVVKLGIEISREAKWLGLLWISNYKLHTQMCKFLRTHFNFAREIHPDGEGNARGEQNKMAAVFADLLTQKSTQLSTISLCIFLWAIMPRLDSGTPCHRHRCRRSYKCQRNWRSLRQSLIGPRADGIIIEPRMEVHNLIKVIHSSAKQQQDPLSDRVVHRIKSGNFSRFCPVWKLLNFLVKFYCTTLKAQCCVSVKTET